MGKITSTIVVIFMFMLGLSGIASALQVFYDDFSGGTLSDWTVLSGSWSIVNEELSQSVVDWSYTRGQIAINGLDLKDLSVEVDVKFVELHPSSHALAHSWTYAGFAVRYFDENTFYWIVLKQTADENGLPNSNMKLELRAGFNYITVVDLGFVGELGTPYTLRAEVIGDTFKVYVDDVLHIEALDTAFSNSGSIRMWTGRCSASFDNVIVHNPHSLHVVPEPAPVIVTALSIAALVTYILIRKRPNNQTLIKTQN